jgi:hypothetical protein
MNTRLASVILLPLRTERNLWVQTNYLRLDSASEKLYENNIIKPVQTSPSQLEDIFLKIKE